MDTLSDKIFRFTFILIWSLAPIIIGYCAIMYLIERGFL